MRRSLTDTLAAVVVASVGIVFLLLARQIRTPAHQTAAEALVGPAMVPTIIAWLVIALGVAQLVFSLRGTATGGQDEGIGDLSLVGVLRLVAIVVIGFAYVWLIGTVGYAIATAIVLVMLLALFGNRSVVQLVLVSLLGAAIYYFIFIRLMGVYLPAGRWINLG